MQHSLMIGCYLINEYIPSLMIYEDISDKHDECFCSNDGGFMGLSVI